MMPAVGAYHALAAAFLFGASTPLAKELLGQLSPWLLAGLLYLGSGVGLTAIRLFRDRRWTTPALTAPAWRALLGAILLGGMAAPVALMVGLTHTSGATASLLLNLEVVLTALLAWLVFGEHLGPRVTAGMLAIVAGGVALSWTSEGQGDGGWVGPLAIALACLGWALDNNLTRAVAGADALFVAALKGLVAGLVNTTLALAWGAALPAPTTALLAMALGVAGYGLSLVLFVLALRELGSARSGAYFSTAPFMGAAVAIVLLGEAPAAHFWLGAALMAVGIGLHLSERHDHLHTHEPQAHEHWHVHDEHHRHAHGDGLPPDEGHSHWHVHEPLTHSHPHFPDIHHRHPH